MLICVAEKDDFRNRLQIFQRGGEEPDGFCLFMVTVIFTPFLFEISPVESFGDVGKYMPVYVCGGGHGFVCIACCLCPSFSWLAVPPTLPRQLRFLR